MYMRVNRTVVLYDSAGIDNHVFADKRVRVNDCPGQHSAANSQSYPTTNDCGRMHDSRNGGVPRLFPEDDSSPRTILPDCRNDGVDIEVLPKRDSPEHWQPQERS